jgi:hypothetical protein
MAWKEFTLGWRERDYRTAGVPPQLFDGAPPLPKPVFFTQAPPLPQKAVETTFQGDNKPSAWVKRCSTAIARSWLESLLPSLSRLGAKAALVRCLELLPIASVEPSSNDAMGTRMPLVFPQKMKLRVLVRLGVTVLDASSFRASS